MNTAHTPLPKARPADGDLQEQAQPGYGIPSQDPNPAAQTALSPEEAQRESNSALLGGGLVAGMATGAAIGVSLAGPAGAISGATLGALVGSVGGIMVSAATDTAQNIQTDVATASSVLLHIEDSGGGGRPVVLIHGWPLSAQAWEAQVESLKGAGYRVVAYDRRGFGRSDKEALTYDYDALADDLLRVMDQCGLDDATLVGFSMGGGEVARFVSRCGQARLHSVVLAAAVTPCLMQSPGNPDGPLTPEMAATKRDALLRDRAAYFKQFSKSFFSAKGQLLVTERQRTALVALCQESAPHAALACMEAFSSTDFREDLKQLTVPTLVIHGDDDAVVPIEGSGVLTHLAVASSTLVRVPGAPHGMNITHADAFNQAVLSFLRT